MFVMNWTVSYKNLYVEVLIPRSHNMNSFENRDIADVIV
jgi:hypothetical protein